MRRFLAPFALVAVLSLTACGGGDSETESDESAPSDTGQPASTGDVSPCDLTTEETVAEVFGGTVESAAEGEARNCEYTLSGASVMLVEVYYFGTADDWDALKAGYEANRGPLTPVDLGDEAFYPGDLLQNEHVVLAGDTVFAVGVGDFTTEISPGIAELAGIIAGEVD
ncbi:hypothetical protein [Aeromicrobium sp. Leaf350]|uniref:hypothetical protein n=1 Tax=Aeromicrobium sp. Leaf350 TaxID=2876565 RepID=UPI001E32D4FC|nr:hypothetical protein [Aeromicrobium sp. Leaf350]